MESQTSALADRTTRFFWAFLITHVVVWTALPALLYANLPLDSIEMHFWGKQWQWGYHKHPPLAAWVARAACLPCPASPVGIYLASQLCMAACFWSAWRLGRDLVSPQQALLGALLLDCCHFYNYESTILNNNTLLYACWALSVLFLHWALAADRLRWWIAVGICTGLGLLTKYTMALLCLPLAIFLLAHPQARWVWRRHGPYLAVAIALLLFAPHLHWAIANEFPPLRWAADRSGHNAGSWGRLLFPLRFAAAQAAALLPMMLAVLPLAGWRWRLRRIDGRQRLARDFLLTVAMGPFVLHLLVSALLNLRLRTIWGSPLWTFVGVLLLFSFALHHQPQRWRSAFAVCLLLAAAMIGVRTARLVGGQWAGRSQRELFQGHFLAQRAEELWSEHAKGPLPIVAGDGWLAGNISFHGASQPAVYGLMDLPTPPQDRRICPWLDDRTLAERGGIFVWQVDDPDAAATLTAMQERFTKLHYAGIVEIPYRGRAPPAKVGLALISPAGDVRYASRPPRN